MDYVTMTAPCGLDCFNCQFFLANEDPDALAEVKALSEQLNVPVQIMLCRGCRAHNGQIPLQKHLFGEKHYCAAYECSQSRGATFCGDCHEFPCDHLHPYADKASVLPHNTKVFNLCLIKRMGLIKWARSKAAAVRKTYFTESWRLTGKLPEGDDEETG